MTKAQSLSTIKDHLQTIQDLQDPYFQTLSLDSRAGVKKLIQQRQKQILKAQEMYQEHLKRLKFEQAYWQNGLEYIAGVDEVGRGPLAGPVVVAAVILSKDTKDLVGVRDSKRLSKNQISQFAQIIKDQAIAFQIVEVSVDEIDSLNIYQATKKGMETAVARLQVAPQALLVDAMQLSTNLPQESLIKGDDRSISIAAASILAKDYRDRLMVELAKDYPEFGFESNVGYGTKSHLQALSQYGYTPIHRKTFAPVNQMTKSYQGKH